MKNECLFCTAKAGSREHIISDSVMVQLGFSQSEFAVAAYGETSGFKRRKSYQRQGSFVTRSVCKACNEGWMSGLECEMVEFLKVTDNGRHGISEATRYREVRKVVLWMLKTAITVNEAMIYSSKSFPSRAFRHKLPIAKIPLFTMVDIASSQSYGWNFHITRSLTIHGSGEPEFKATENSFHFGIQLGLLLLRVVCAPGLEVHRNGSAPIIWPEHDQVDRFCAKTKYLDIHEFASTVSGVESSDGRFRIRAT